MTPKPADNFDNMGILEMAKTLGEMGDQMKKERPHTEACNAYEKGVDTRCWCYKPNPAAHAPMPWKLEYIGDAEKCHPAIIWAPLLEVRFSRAEDFGDPLPHAAFIVRACNNFEELLAICTEFCSRVEHGEIRSTYTYNRMKKAIAKAESL